VLRSGSVDGRVAERDHRCEYIVESVREPVVEPVLASPGCPTWLRQDGVAVEHLLEWREPYLAMVGDSCDGGGQFRTVDVVPPDQGVDVGGAGTR
jgi:hypothetical protein